MLGPSLRRVKVGLLACCVAAALSGCGRGVPSTKAVSTHIDVLTAIAQKGVDLVAAGRFSAESMPELTYPLERAQALAARAHAAAPPPVWLPAFDAVLARYRDLLDAIDRARREQRGDAARSLLQPELDALLATASAAKAALQAS
jgi:hypothetical protein